MQILFKGVSIHISDWSVRLKYAMLFFAVLTVVALSLFLGGNFRFPFLFFAFLCGGVTAFLFSIKQLNLYFKLKKTALRLSLAIAGVTLFTLGLYAGIWQIVSVLISL